LQKSADDFAHEKAAGVAAIEKGEKKLN